ncbi:MULTISPECIES: helix-turn-helix domain-containing protein [unclassified Kaistella]|uniref:XRE family transcriptional regulator n=1 Tax=unclassified Kaistella TaxID=2762626 RepID=UPI00273608F0|nr:MULTISPECIES: helix-turn-helix domain-containing protein [unclassified Kaistella]MDP2454495.1 helix-turn-helix domain-containing protein [Kaistella sp. SH11-4b]MDP2457233.1 helix-turn-helix domain-containing protein [Kaistella sp. SH40-3]MDP2459993.1 helix-turn-helix domain-containing protein [Kaistella sp. SH19-2b]
MSILSENMRYLRGQQKYSQQKIADNLLITRGRYAKYEDGSSEPPIEILIRLSKYYRISIDLLVGLDLSKYSLEKMMKLPDNRTILPIMVDEKGENKIEIIPEKAQMGYLQGYSDPEYIEKLQTISLPFLRNGKFRAFPASGDSMPPFKDGTFIVGKYVENVSDLKKDKTYIFITQNEGVVYKRFEKKTSKSITVSSDNPLYKPYDIKLSELVEIWEYACSINTAEFETETLDMMTVKEMFLSLKKEIDLIKKR